MKDKIELMNPLTWAFEALQIGSYSFTIVYKLFLNNGFNYSENIGGAPKVNYFNILKYNLY